MAGCEMARIPAAWLLPIRYSVAGSQPGASDAVRLSETPRVLHAACRRDDVAAYGARAAVGGRASKGGRNPEYPKRELRGVLPGTARGRIYRWTKHHAGCEIFARSA